MNPLSRSPLVKCRASRLAVILAVSLVTSARQVRAFVPTGVTVATCSSHGRISLQTHERSELPRGRWIPSLRAWKPDDATAADEGGTDGGDSSSSGDGSGSSSTSSSENGSKDIWARAELPLSNDQQVEQATRAVWQAFADGKKRQILRLSLPLIGATEMDDWPGGDRQRYKACGPMVKTLLLGSPAAAEEGASVVEQILDESDAVGLMQLQCKEAKDDASVMIFPTADTLSLQQQVTSSAGPRLVALVNPAWKSVSDFGLFGAGEAKKALSEFEVTYSLQSRVVYGYTLRLLYSYPGPWRLFLIGEETGTRELLGSWGQSPPNDEVEKVVFEKKGRPNATERVQASAKFFQDGM